MSSFSIARPSCIFVKAVRSCRNKTSTTVRTVANGTGTFNDNRNAAENDLLITRAFATSSEEGRGDKARNWFHSISFTSPEADFTFQAPTPVEDVETLKNRKAFIDHIQKEEEHRNDFAYSLSHASIANDFDNPFFIDLLDDRMKSQLDNTRLLHQTSTLSEHVNPRELSPCTSDHDGDAPVEEERESPLFDRHIFHEEPLPHNLQEASLPEDSRAIVITEAAMPFRIISVNHSWENLCGYSQNEVNGRTLECLQGEETNKFAVTALMAQMLKGEEAGTLLTNYTKEGRKFHNRLRVRPLRNNDGKITHFAGVLKEVNEIGEHFDGSMMHV
jgi:PAS domain S-box-containing protein